MHISERIREARKATGHTQKTIAEALGTTQQQYSRYEKGDREMETSRFKTFCEICNADANWILGIGKYSIEN